MPEPKAPATRNRKRKLDQISQSMQQISQGTESKKLKEDSNFKSSFMVRRIPKQAVHNLSMVNLGGKQSLTKIYAKQQSKNTIVYHKQEIKQRVPVKTTLQDQL